ncbi:hypothetical protein ABH935_005736 [Catenulispora sp. GAS73]|uniref:hypothetical protein n=1 Tax=Catenulispora sp. GAS73 TaxID=3156269 RepID=UPI003511FD1D
MSFRMRRRGEMSDGELDALLASVQQKQLAEITRRLDLDTAFQAVLDTVTHQPPAIPAGIATGSEWPQDRDKITVDVYSDAVSVVCEVLTALDMILDRFVDTEDAARAHTARSTGFVMVAGGHLTGLIRGLAQRALTRPQALSVFDLVDHNLREATLLLRGEREIAGSRAIRQACQERAAVLADAVARLPELRARVAALFDDAPRVADLVGTPG